MADDHQVILDALSVMLKTEYEVHAVDNYVAFVDSVDTFRPDVALLDVTFPGGDGFAAAQQVLEKSPDLPIVFLSMHSEPTYVDRAVEVGAKAYFSKLVPASELLNGVRAVLEGQNLISETQSKPAATAQNGASELTGRQIEVLRLIAAGSTAKDIAKRLNISVRTAEFHRAGIMQRLNLHSTAQMTRYALAHNLG